MEIITLTRDQIVNQYPNCSSIEVLIKAIEINAAREGMVVCGIEVNGMVLSEDDERRLAASLITEIDTLSVTVEQTKQLVADTLVNLRSGLAGVRDRSLRVADLIRENPAGPAQHEFSGLMEQTKFITDALGALKPRLVRNPDSVKLWQTAEAENRRTILELLEAFKNSDFTLVSDVLEYEIHNLMSLWIRVLDECHFD